MQTVFLQDNVISQIHQDDLSLLMHLHYLYLQVKTKEKKILKPTELS